MNRNLSVIGKLNPLFFCSARGCSSKSPREMHYLGFTYYPRHADFKDPPYNPSKLFLVTRIKSTSGLNPEERAIITNLNLDGPKKTFGHVAIHKNIPEVNAKLWKVKHLVEIKPITWKGELPKDFSGTYLRQTGELVISPMLNVSPEVVNKSKECHNCKTKLTRRYLKNYLLSQWIKGHYCGS